MLGSESLEGRSVCVIQVLPKREDKHLFRGPHLGRRLPKPLVRFEAMPLLERVMSGAKQAGIECLVIVIGHQAQLVRGGSKAVRFALSL
jgi:hypothetical protein